MNYSSRITIQLKSNISRRFPLFAFSSLRKFLHLLIEYFSRENYIRHNFRRNFLRPGIISGVISRNNSKKNFPRNFFSFQGKCAGLGKIPWKIHTFSSSLRIFGHSRIRGRRSIPTISINDSERGLLRGARGIRMREETNVQDFVRPVLKYDFVSKLDRTNHGLAPAHRILHILMERLWSAWLSFETRRWL